jgi:hypothetical protein
MTVRAEPVQAGTTHRLSLLMETSPAESGKPEAFLLQEAMLTVGSTVTDLEVAESWVAPKMSEVAYPVGGEEAALTAFPVYGAGSGGGGENIHTLTVDDSSPFSSGDYLRAKDKGASHVYEVLTVPDGTTITIHAGTGNFDIEDGDTVEQVTPTGVYCGELLLPVDTYFSAGQPLGSLRLVMTTVDTGDDPIFSAAVALTWVVSFSLDLAGRAFRVG